MLSNMLHPHGRSTKAMPVVVAFVVLVAVSCASDGAEESVDGDGATAIVSTTVAERATTVDEVANAADDDDEVTDESMRIGLVAPSAVDDRAWTQSMVDSINRVAAARAIDVDVSADLPDADDAAAAIRAYAEEGVDLVIVHGSQFGGALEEIAAEFANVSFAFGASTASVGGDNVFAYSADADQGGYVNGVIAAQLTSSNIIGVIGPVPASDAALYVNGFVAGVAASDPSIEVDVNYIDSFSDTRLASEAATAITARGADVLTGTGQMVAGATSVAAEQNIAWFGNQSNQTDLAATVVVASQVYHWEIVLDQMLDRIAAGTLGGESFVISFQNLGLQMEFNSGFALDADVRAAADSAIAGVSDGSIEVPRGS